MCFSKEVRERSHRVKKELNDFVQWRFLSTQKSIYIIIIYKCSACLVFDVCLQVILLRKWLLTIWTFKRFLFLVLLLMPKKIEVIIKTSWIWKRMLLAKKICRPINQHASHPVYIYYPTCIVPFGKVLKCGVPRFKVHLSFFGGT